MALFGESGLEAEEGVPGFPTEKLTATSGVKDLRGDSTADSEHVGGGNTGIWQDSRILDLEAEARRASQLVQFRWQFDDDSAPKLLKTNTLRSK